MEPNVQSTSNGELVDKLKVPNNPVQLTENRGSNIMGSQDLEMVVHSLYRGDLAIRMKDSVHVVHLGKVGVTREEIKSVGGILNLELIEKDFSDATKLAEEKGDRSTARR